MARTYQPTKQRRGTAWNLEFQRYQQKEWEWKTEDVPEEDNKTPMTKKSQTSQRDTKLLFETMEEMEDVVMQVPKFRSRRRKRKKPKQTIAKGTASTPPKKRRMEDPCDVPVEKRTRPEVATVVVVPRSKKVVPPPPPRMVVVTPEKKRVPPLSQKCRPTPKRRILELARRRDDGRIVVDYATTDDSHVVPHDPQNKRYTQSDDDNEWVRVLKEKDREIVSYQQQLQDKEREIVLLRQALARERQLQRHDFLLEVEV